jgi:aldehyde dehydrogenase (NAD+)
MVICCIFVTNKTIMIDPSYIYNILSELGLKQRNAGTSTGVHWEDSDKTLMSSSPVDGKNIGTVSITTKKQYQSVINQATTAFGIWRSTPAPQRGEIVRQFGEELRKKKTSTWDFGFL